MNKNDISFYYAVGFTLSFLMHNKLYWVRLCLLCFFKVNSTIALWVLFWVAFN